MLQGFSESCTRLDMAVIKPHAKGLNVRVSDIWLAQAIIPLQENRDS